MSEVTSSPSKNTRNPSGFGSRSDSAGSGCFGDAVGSGEGDGLTERLERYRPVHRARIEIQPSQPFGCVTGRGRDVLEEETRLVEQDEHYRDGGEHATSPAIIRISSMMRSRVLR